MRFDRFFGISESAQPTEDFEDFERVSLLSSSESSDFNALSSPFVFRS